MATERVNAAPSATGFSGARTQLQTQTHTHQHTYACKAVLHVFMCQTRLMEVLQHFPFILYLLHLFDFFLLQPQQQTRNLALSIAAAGLTARSRWTGRYETWSYIGCLAASVADRLVECQLSRLQYVVVVVV